MITPARQTKRRRAVRKIPKRKTTREFRSHSCENFWLGDHAEPGLRWTCRVTWCGGRAWHTVARKPVSNYRGDDMIQPIDIGVVAGGTFQGYSNQVLTRVNDHEVHLSVMDAPYFWHLHPDSDETFFVVEGALTVDFEDGSVDLQVGQLLTVPAGMRHRTRPLGPRSVNLTVEKANAATVRCDAPPRWTTRAE
jgi:mannose-6-phosphate isomerase-like protein (cupin superfamily)